MASLFTKNGKPLTLRGDDFFDRAGRHVGRRRGNKVYGPDGRYAGTIVGDRVVYRSTDSATISSPFAARAGTGSASAERAGSAIRAKSLLSDGVSARSSGGPRPRTASPCDLRVSGGRVSRV
jgi:hypothetical protein